VKTHTEGGREADADRLTVGLSEWRVAADGETLVSHGVGSSVVVALYDPQTGVAGLARATLPRRAEARSSSAAASTYADAAVRELLESMIEAGASYSAVRGWLVGGSEMFDLERLSTDTANRTVEAAAETLARLNVELVDRAVADGRGRTVELDAATGEVTLRTAHHGVSHL
jgi:chemotaxis protein CheD